MQDSFFEVDYPARSQQPDPLRFYRNGPPSLNAMDDGRRLKLHDQVKTFPSIGAIKELLDALDPADRCISEPEMRRRFPSPLQRNGLPRFPVKKQLGHLEVLSHVQTLGYPKGSPRSDGGAQKEQNAWSAVGELFALSSSPNWNKTADFGKVLTLEMAFPSVWLETEITKIPKVLDQLWVLSSFKDPKCKVLLAVEIDGMHKFNVSPTETSYPLLSQSERTKELFAAGLNVCRIDSDHCGSVDSAKRQMQEVWDRLCACEVVLSNSRWTALIDQFEDLDHRLVQAKIWAQDGGAPRFLNYGSGASGDAAPLPSNPSARTAK